LLFPAWSIGENRKRRYGVHEEDIPGAQGGRGFVERFRVPTRFPGGEREIIRGKQEPLYIAIPSVLRPAASLSADISAEEDEASMVDEELKGYVELKKKRP
jgi:hypothetical protein